MEKVTPSSRAVKIVCILDAIRVCAHTGIPNALDAINTLVADALADAAGLADEIAAMQAKLDALLNPSGEVVGKCALALFYKRLPTPYVGEWRDTTETVKMRYRNKAIAILSALAESVK